MKKTIVIAVLFITLLSSTIAYFTIFNKYKGLPREAYNMNPDTSQKIIGSKSISPVFDRIIPKNLEECVQFADLIVIAKVVSPGTTKMVEFPFQKGSEMIDKSTGQPVKYSVCSSQLQIERVIYGKDPGEIITLSQLGPSDSNNGETKVKNGDKMLFILRKVDSTTNKNVYSNVFAEDSMFLIDENNKLTSLSDNLTVAKYGGLKVSTHEADLKAALKNVKK
jgi:hypothetical protein